MWKREQNGGYLAARRWFAKLQFASLRIKKELYEEYYRDTCNITKENMTAFLQANSGYMARQELKKCQAKAFVFVGGKEQQRMIRSAYCLHKMLPDSELMILDKGNHGEFSINHASEYADKIEEILNDLQDCDM